MVEDMGKVQHEVKLVNRNRLEISGVTNVESFDTEEFLLQTDHGFLGIRGQDLHIKNLDLEQGKVSIQGQIMDISYLDANLPRAEKGKSLLGRLLR